MKKNYSGKERRKYPRTNKKLIVTYRLKQDSDKVNITQTKNLSLGGMLLSTNKAYACGDQLLLEVMLPFFPNKFNFFAQVVESKEIIKNLIYDTRVFFLTMDERSKASLKKAVAFYLKTHKGKK